MGHHRPSEAGAFDFGSNYRAYTDSGAQIEKEKVVIRHRREGEHTVGNGHFIRLEKLRSTQRQALIKILEGIGIFAVAAGAAATIIIASDGCGEKSAPKEDVNSIALDL